MNKYPYIAVKKLDFSNSIMVLFTSENMGIILNTNGFEEELLGISGFDEALYEVPLKYPPIQLTSDGYPRLMRAVFRDCNAPELIVLFIAESRGVVIKTGIPAFEEEPYQEDFAPWHMEQHWERI